MTRQRRLPDPPPRQTAPSIPDFPAARPARDRFCLGLSDLLFGQDGVGVANNHTDIVAALHDLNRVKKSGRPVFVTEHIAPEEVAVRTGAHQTLSALGFIARFEAGERRS